MLQKVRDSNIELYRILLMLLIIAHHYVVNSGLSDILNDNIDSGRSLFYFFIGMWGKTGINCFVLITGYFMCTSTITLRKFIKLLLEVEFYNVAIFLLFFITGYETFSLKGLLYAFWPIQSISDGFASCYLIFYLFIPFLNILVYNIEKKNHKYLICLFLFVYTVIDIIPSLTVQMNYVTWFCVLYFIGSYIRKYRIFVKDNSFYWGCLLLLSVMTAFVCTMIIAHFDASADKSIPPMYFVKKPSSVLALVVSVCAFNYFRTIRIPYSKFINLLASSCFGVLMIHANSDTMRRWLWKDTLQVVDQYYSDTFVLHALFSVVAIYVICTIIDQLRIILVEKPVLSYFDAYFNN